MDEPEPFVDRRQMAAIKIIAVLGVGNGTHAMAMVVKDELLVANQGETNE